MHFSSLAAPSEPLCYSHCVTLPELPGCRCSRSCEYQRAAVALVEPSHQPLSREASSSSCVETCSSRFDPDRLCFQRLSDDSAVFSSATLACLSVSYAVP